MFRAAGSLTSGEMDAVLGVGPIAPATNRGFSFVENFSTAWRERNRTFGDYQFSGYGLVEKIQEGERVIEGFRSLAGATDPTVAAPGTIRGDLARQQATKVVQNIVHGSDSVESAEREISIFFGGK